MYVAQLIFSVRTQDNLEEFERTVYWKEMLNSHALPMRKLLRQSQLQFSNFYQTMDTKY